ncbi:MAG: sugar phosphate isomerase/epimerase [Lentisphaeria bacterium]|nr:sugar phosphate isomerase/epimerase [Lentisphaeria bacterium]
MSFRHLSPAQIIDVCVQARVSGIEWGGDVHVPHGDLDCACHVRDLTTGAKLEVAAYGSYYRAGVSEEEGLTFSAVLESALALGTPTIRVWAGALGSEQADDSYRSHVQEDLLRIAYMSAEQGVSVATEYHQNTLTDTLESTLRMLEFCEPAEMKTYWQAPGGLDLETSLHDLRAVLPNLSNVHVQHWVDTPGGRRRCPLEDGQQRWSRYLDLVSTVTHDPWVLIEFVQNDDPEQFVRDAKSLHRFCSEANSHLPV